VVQWSPSSAYGHLLSMSLLEVGATDSLEGSLKAERFALNEDDVGSNPALPSLLIGLLTARGDALNIEDVGSNPALSFEEQHDSTRVAQRLRP
jgi:hypothetical protein